MSSFHNILFPPDVSWGSSGGPIFKTEVFSALNGKEKRNIDWSQPMMNFNIAYGIRTDVQMERVVNFFNARNGMKHGFRYKNWADYTVDNSPFAVGDGYSNRLPIWKYYGVPPSGTYKRLSHIVLGTVVNVTIEGVSQVLGEDFTIDYTAGEIVLLNTALPFGVTIEGSLEFDEPVAFDTDSIQQSIDAYNSNSLSSLNLTTYRNPLVLGAPFSQEDKDVATDVHLKNLSALIAFGTVPKDISPNRSVLALLSGASVDTTKTLTTDGSLVLNSTGYVTVEQNSALGSGAFTIEANITNGGGSSKQHIVCSWGGGGDNSWDLRYDSTISQLQFVVSTDGVNEIILLRALWPKYTESPFEFISVDRDVRGLYTMRVNGNTVASVTHNETLHTPTTNQVSVGGDSTIEAGYTSFTGNIDTIRLTRGLNRNMGSDSVTIPHFFEINY